jgi:hypothetical protein
MSKSSLLTLTISGLTIAGSIIFPVVIARIILCLLLVLPFVVGTLLLNLVISFLLKEKSWVDRIDEYFKRR